MRILFLAHSFNSLAQRLWAELGDDGHETTLELDVNDATTLQAVELARPDVVVAPFLKRAIPEVVWRTHRCLVVHPGIEGDRGPSALDWAIVGGERDWGVTVIEANGVLDGGDVRSSVPFAMRDTTKASLYRNEVTEAAVIAVREALAAIARGEPARAFDASRAGVRGIARPPMRQADRAIDWARDESATVLRKVRASDGVPGVRDTVLGVDCLLFDAHAGPLGAKAPPGDVIAWRDGAVLRATRDGSVWLTHARRAGDAGAVKLPAVDVLGRRLEGVPEHRDATGGPPTPIRYEERGHVGVLHFAFHNGAMSTAACQALRAAIAHAKARPTCVLLLAGGPDFWSNGLDLNAIEASPHPADASLANLLAMNDVVREIVVADRQLTVAALQGNAGAGGAFLALAADRVLVRSGAVLNPHYRAMGNLYGSEYWTYLLPRRVGAARAEAIAASRLPMTGTQAARSGLADAAFGATPASFLAEALAHASELAGSPMFSAVLAHKRERRARDEADKPLERYAEEELDRMRLNFYGFDASYHVARHHFVCKLGKARTPSFLARHRIPRGRGDAAIGPQ